MEGISKNRYTATRFMKGILEMYPVIKNAVSVAFHFKPLDVIFDNRDDTVMIRPVTGMCKTKDNKLIMLEQPHKFHCPIILKRSQYSGYLPKNTAEYCALIIDNTEKSFTVNNNGEQKVAFYYPHRIENAKEGAIKLINNE